MAIPIPGMGVFDQQVIDGLKAAVEHLYTFDGSDAAVLDSKGDADGTILGWDGGSPPASVQSGGDLTFSGNNAYVDLGSGFITAGSGASNAVSIEAFITVSQPVPFARLYDFGTQEKDAQLAPLSYMFMAPSDGAFPKVVSKGANGQEEGMVSQKPLPQGQMVHIVVTYEEKSFIDGDLEAKTEVFLWVNAAPVVAGRWRGVLSELTDVNCWLNRSQYPDGGLNAKLHELRVYPAVLNQQQVQNSFAAGIDALNP
jgi:hypothetical protein